MTHPPQELKPCPFCGEKPKEGEVINSHGKFYTIWCCFARMEFHSYQLEEYVTRWNTRCAAEPIDAALEQAAIIAGTIRDELGEFISCSQHAQSIRDLKSTNIPVSKWPEPVDDKSVTNKKWSEKSSQEIKDDLNSALKCLKENTTYEPVDAGELTLEWRDGFPSNPWDKEWFIAVTIYGDRVVLKALPEEYSYDFKTADETYIKKENIQKWMQFPDSEYTAPDRTSLSNVASVPSRDWNGELEKLEASDLSLSQKFWIGLLIKQERDKSSNPTQAKGEV